MISVVIPTDNDQALIGGTIEHLRRHAYTRLLTEIIVVDAGSADNTVREATNAGARVLRSIRRDRAAQLNLGAEQASGTILYFVIPGAFPPVNFSTEVVRAMQHGHSSGAFTVDDSKVHWAFRALNNMLPRVTQLETQSLFVAKELFLKAGKFQEGCSLLEERVIMHRLQRYGNFKLLPDKITSSPRLHIRHGVVRTELSEAMTSLLLKIGYPAKKLQSLRSKLLGKREAKPAPEKLAHSF